MLVGALTLTLMLVWRRGHALAFAKRDGQARSLDEFVQVLNRPGGPLRAPGTGIYPTDQTKNAPRALLQNLRHNGVVHEHVVLLNVITSRSPRVAEVERLEARQLLPDFQLVQMQFGFAETPDVPAALEAHREVLGFDPTLASFFLGRETPVPALHPDIPRWQERIYAFLTHNAVRAPDYFLIPAAQVVELGTRVEM